ncbi:MAG: RNA polymerase subunit sigma-24 [Anaerolineae bacterium]|nr:MAG: RNA polymerase subunit sigma-24 [Anaerolineae bacterium]
MTFTHAECEELLIAQAQRGDRQAYGELVQRYFPGVVRVAYRLCGDADLAQDAAQEAFLKAWLNLHSFRAGTSLRNWLYRIVVNTILDTLRRNTKTVETALEDLPLSDPLPLPEEHLFEHERAQIVQRALLSLPSASRSVLVLREYGELSYQEIAEALGIPLGTVMSRLHAARAQLKRLLELHLTDLEMKYV